MACAGKLTVLAAAVLALALVPRLARAGPPPPFLPRYDLDMELDLPNHMVHAHMLATWTNCSSRPADELVFNAHSHFKVPQSDIPKLAKTLEIMRMSPSTSLDGKFAAFEVQDISMIGAPGTPPLPLKFEFRSAKTHEGQADTETALAIALPAPVMPGVSVTVAITFTLKLPQQCGRWGQWKGVTFLSNWLPVFAFHDEEGWHPTPFVPWHQPFFNDSCYYRVRAVLPADQKIACTGTIVAHQELDNGCQEVHIQADGVRDFAFLCSARYVEFCGEAGPVKVKCLAFPEHEHYAREMVRSACEAIPVYSEWFGPYPYPEFTIAESSFGWNGNECSTLIMIDDRVFDMPHLAGSFVDYLISHETCHQWWYNMVGTNGYCETWMDEALAVYFSHRLTNQKIGKNNNLLDFPKALCWLPNIQRDTYRVSGLYAALGRGDQMVTVQEMEQYRHVANLFAMCYDKGGKIVGMIEDRLGEDAFIDFMRVVFTHYQYRVLRVDDFQRELEAYTGHSWDEFFRNWLHGSGLSDWAVEKVKISNVDGSTGGGFLSALHHGPTQGPCQATVVLHQKAEIDEQTVLGISFCDGDNYPVRVPIVPQAGPQELEDPPARIEPLPDHRIRVIIELPCEPTQISVDPDQVLVDKNPANNHWKKPVNFRITPLYTFLDETDLTTVYDRWNVIAGPWFFDSSYEDPWFTRSAMLGVRAGAYRTQEFSGGVYAAYRVDYRDLVAGVDALWVHTPWAPIQFGINLEQRLASAWGNADQDAQRVAVFGRYVFLYSSSLYLPPMQYVEAFGLTESNFLPVPRESVPGAQRYDRLNTVGIHFHQDYLTPYWDPEAGFRIDLTYQGGVGEIQSQEAVQEATGDLSFVKSLPEGLGWFSQTRLAAHLYGAAGLPNNVQFFTLGGSNLFRGFDISQKQGADVWVASLEWRVPVIPDIHWDIFDHCLGFRAINLAMFYDAGDALTSGHSGGTVAQALGAGLRIDTALFGFVERASLRLDVAKAVNYNTPYQVWFGFVHPF
jgi:hypothetical protein